MTNIVELFTDIIYILFPFLCYTIYTAYCNDINKKESSLLLSVVLFISMYLSSRQLITSKIIYAPLMFNIPLIIAYMKNKNAVGIVMSIFIITNYYMINKFSLNLLIIEYTLYFIIYNILPIKDRSKNLYIAIFCIIKIPIYLTQLYYAGSAEIEIINSIILLIPFITSNIIIINLLEKSERIVNLNITIKELEREKQLRKSLFNIAHEIKNPLAVCSGYLEMFDFKNKTHEKYIPIIKEELKRSITLMNDMLNFTKIKIEPNVMDINILLEDIKLCTWALIKGKNIKINIKIPKEEIYIYADYTRLKTVFIDAIKNSITAILEQNKSGLISIDVVLKKNKIITTIKDNSKGMTKEELKQLYMPFYISESKNAALGITLASEIIKGHKGEIEYSSKYNKGTTIKITLPKIKTN